MRITGEMLIGARTVRGSHGTIHAVNPATGKEMEPAFGGGASEDVDAACALAGAAFDTYRGTSLELRAKFLEAIAQGIMDLGDELVERVMSESGLLRPRIEGERARTCGQLRLFASIVREGRWINVIVDPALPDRKPLPRPDLRSQKIPLGPVAVFGASNFPLAFSVAGGDTAAALAVGCPVVAKSHPSHLGTSELVGRVIGQLRLFASIVREGRWINVIVDPALPDRKPFPRPDLRSQKIPLGPVAVFGASNFPLAFSVAGGDTAAALAVGCPVVAKSHRSHLGTSELVGRVIQAAVATCALPEGVFSLLVGDGNAVGEALVKHPVIQAVAFTGSRRGGLALVAAAASRPQPIPVFAEMSSTNPVFLLPEALAVRGAAIATGLVESATLGVGQFCTKPGIVIGIEGPAFDQFSTAAAKAVETMAAGTMLNEGIHKSYVAGTAALSSETSVRQIADGQPPRTTACSAQAMLFTTSAQAFLSTPPLAEEVFGPATLAEHLSGQLTATLHLADADHAIARQLLPILERKAGRILVNGFPTGVEVSHAMVHGGPFPSTSDSRATSVGAMAIERFLRPVCYQNFPAGLLPEATQDCNPQSLWRVVDGKLQQD